MLRRRQTPNYSNSHNHSRNNNNSNSNKHINRNNGPASWIQTQPCSHSAHHRQQGQVVHSSRWVCLIWTTQSKAVQCNGIMTGAHIGKTNNWIDGRLTENGHPYCKNDVCRNEMQEGAVCVILLLLYCCQTLPSAPSQPWTDKQTHKWTNQKNAHMHKSTNPSINR